eukprot:TRINITY_DN63293_c0_g1_i1.p1 TRINITY_DN63293_c0_g1~~TRINITY_DN63293_c0_g1_i1.p1  ORF type:complete len:228 (+),score=79.80 TRINITY_DN63293_c0_g1_i1:82-765(+)
MSNSFGGLFGCCETVASKTGEFVDDVKEKGVAIAAQEAGQELQEAGKGLLEDAKSGKLVEDLKEAAATAQQKLKEDFVEVKTKAETLVEDAKSGKLAEDIQVAAADAAQTAQVAVAAVEEQIAEAVAGEFTVHLQQKGGEEKEIKFTSRPLGIGFGPQKTPAGCCSGGKDTGKIVVTRYENYPNLKDVKMGMIFTKVNGVPVPESIEMTDFRDLMKKGSENLPEEKK